MKLQEIFTHEALVQSHTHGRRHADHATVSKTEIWISATPISLNLVPILLFLQFTVVALLAVVCLTFAEEPAEKKDEEVESRVGYGGGFSGAQGGSQYGFNRGASGFNQGSGGFDSVNRYNNVQGFRNRDGYRTNQGFDQTTYNRHGAGGAGFAGGFNRGAGGFYNQHGQQGGFYG